MRLIEIKNFLIMRIFLFSELNPILHLINLDILLVKEKKTLIMFQSLLKNPIKQKPKI